MGNKEQRVWGKKNEIEQQFVCVNTQWLTALQCLKLPEMWNWESQRLFWIEMQTVFALRYSKLLRISSFPNKGKRGICMQPYKGSFCSWHHQNESVYFYGQLDDGNKQRRWGGINEWCFDWCSDLDTWSHVFPKRDTKHRSLASLFMVEDLSLLSEVCLWKYGLY